MLRRRSVSPKLWLTQQARVWLGRAVAIPQHHNEHRPTRPILFAVDQQLGEGATLWVAPEQLSQRTQRFGPT